MTFKINISEKAIYLTRKRLWEDEIRIRGLFPSSPPLECPPLECLEKDERFYRKCTFAILEEEVEKWKNNPHFRGIWKGLLHYIIILREEDIVALSFEILPKDKVDVLDRAPIARYHLKHRGPASQEAYKNYIASCIPLNKYDGRYELPELVIWSPIEARRLRVAKGVVEYSIKDRIKNSFFGFLNDLRNAMREQDDEPVSAGRHWKETRFS